MKRRAGIGVLVALCAVTLGGHGALAADGPSPAAATANTVNVPPGPASVAGMGSEADIEAFSGQLAYRIDFELPDGPAGIVPSLGLSYHGELGNGVAGIGWSLGVPSIRRSLREGVPSYSDADEFEISGIASGRLVRAPSGQYFVEGEGKDLRVVRDGARWVVTNSAGIRFYFGISAAARLEGPAGTAAWNLELVVHPTGNTIEYGYERHLGESYLRSVWWGPRRMFKVDLTYQDRYDTVTSWARGFEVITARRLASVAVRSSDVEVRAYRLEYSEGFAVSRLAAVRATGLLGNGQLPTVTFAYGGRDPASSTRAANIDGWALNIRGTVLHDVDGDGIADLLRLEAGNNEWRRNQGAAFGPRQTLPGANAALADIQLIDLDGDAKAELVRVVNDTWRVSRLEDSGWVSAGVWPGSTGVPLRGDGVELADVDGDGRTDVLQAAGAGLIWWRNTSNGFSAPTIRPAIAGGNPAVALGLPTVQLHDHNGDGLVDVVWTTDLSATVFLGHGDGTFSPWSRSSWPWGVSAVTPADLRFGDLNRDGLVDLLRLTTGHVLLYEGRAGGGWSTTPRFVPRPEGADADVVVTFADVNANGSTDVVWSSPRGMWVLDLAGATSAGMLTEIRNGLGKLTRFTYRATAETQLEDERLGHPWRSHAPVSFAVPVEVRVDVGDGSPIRISRSHARDPFWDGEERRFGGFLSSESTSVGEHPGTTAVSLTLYHPGRGAERVLRGQPVHQEVRDGLGRLQTETQTTVEAIVVPGLGVSDLARVAVTRAIRTRHYEGVVVPLETATTFAVDAEGNVIEERALGRLDLPDDDLVTTRRFVVRDEATWIGGGMVCEETRTTAAGAIVARARTVYGGLTADAGECQPGLGLERRALAWLEQEQRWVTLASTTTFDRNWNSLDHTEQGVTRTFAFDADAFRLLSESVSPASGKTLTWAAAWDPILSLPTRVTDPGGIASDLSYDDLGRIVAVARNGAEPHVRYRYDWTAPTPAVEVWTFNGDPSALAGSWSGTWSAAVPWRLAVDVSNGAGEALHSAARLSATTWIIDGVSRRDARGRPTASLDAFEWVGLDPRVAKPTGPVPTHTRALDAFGRVLVDRTPTGFEQRFSYAAFQTSVAADGLATLTTWVDGLGHTRRTQRLVAGVLEEIDSTYDPLGNLTEMSLQGGQVVHSFSYDSLGRLTWANDPDSGPRTFAYLDSGQLASQMNAVGQSVAFTYDGAGRLTTKSSNGTSYTYHYDDARVPGFEHTASRLAWIDEPTGGVDLGYDVWGNQRRFRRTIHALDQPGDLSADEVATTSPGGDVLALSYDDGFEVAFHYDPAGRPTQVGDYWSVLEQDAAGRPLREQFGNGVVQRAQRDALGRPSWVRIERGPLALYEVALTHAPFGPLESIQDLDGRGLDHSAAFAYDEGARLTDATVGTAAPYQFTYQYDGLQNMVQRTASGPAALDLLAGDYQFGGMDALGRAAGPRQLTRVVAAGAPMGAPPTATFAYDAAGRQIRNRGRQLTYNALDQLVRVEGLPGGTGVVEHAYGHDGFRITTKGADGAVRYWFSRGISEANGVREHLLYVGDRLVARVERARIAPGGGGAGITTSTGSPKLVEALAALILLLAALGLVVDLSRRRTVRVRAATATFTAASFLVSLLPATGCGWFVGTSAQKLWEASETRYYHATVSAGPSLMTGDGGRVVEERRFEPFGVAIDCFRERLDGSTEIAAVDFRLDPQNILNQKTDPDTGWSYHGARWLDPATAQWTSPDAPTQLPDAGFVAEPWGLNPYQYVNQNPIAFWDPDGNDRNLLDGAEDIASDTPIVTNGSDEYMTDREYEFYTKGVRPPFISDSPDGIGIVMGNLQIIGPQTPAAPPIPEAPPVQPRIRPGGSPGVGVGPVVLAVAILLVDKFADPQLPEMKDVVPDVPKKQRRAKGPLTYVTYTKINTITGQVYSGRATGYGDPRAIVAARDASHHIRGAGWKDAELDEVAIADPNIGWFNRHSDPAYQAIRGREQQLIDFHGGARSDGGTSGNKIRGVAKDNRLGATYHYQASLKFGTKYRYTGNRSTILP